MITNFISMSILICNAEMFVFLNYILKELFAISHSQSGVISYKAQSQDEEALVRAAAHLHMVFVNKISNILGTVSPFVIYCKKKII